MTKVEIIQWINDYKNPLDDVTKFAKELAECIKKMNFTATNNGVAIGYAGSLRLG